MKALRKKDFDVSEIRRFLEPGPIVLVSSAWKDKTNIMTLGWYTLMEFSPSLIGCIISNRNYSFEMIRQSKQCVINLPARDLAKTVVGIGNCSGEDTDKFRKFRLTPVRGKFVKTPLIKECYANLECKLYDASLIGKYNFFIFKVLKAHVATAPKYPETIHYRGDGVFMVSGKQIRIKSAV
ncbi:MAG: flavin reductase family protein [Alphaproteobacteria bacterium]|nr:flavin reductase family protein [Alphaproteobacteria bacterium]